VTGSPLNGVSGWKTNDGTGGALTVTFTVATPVLPRLSVTRKPTATVPASAYVFEVVGVEPVSVSNEPLPSRSHSYRVIEPFGELDADASKLTV
jgi:hypothetical protein